MKRHMFSLGRFTIAVLLLAALAACVQPGQQVATAPGGALSVDDLLSNLDALQGPAARSLTAPGSSSFTTQAGARLSLADLAAYLNSIKQDLGGYVKGRGAPYFVLPVPISSYPSTDASGLAPLSLSGLMWVPFTWGRHLEAPIISFQHGTQVYRACAPSRFDPNPFSVFSNPDQTGALQNYVECIVGGLMASAGYIVLMPDYPGFGSSDAPHPFVQRSLGNSVRDLVKAAKGRLDGGPVVPDGKVFLTGYSEGGYATMVGAQALQGAIAQPKSPLSWASIRAVVPCDGPYDLSGAMLAQMAGGSVKVPFYLLYTVFGYRSAYPGLIDSLYQVGGTPLLSAPAVKLLTQENIFDGNHTSAQITATVAATFSSPSEMLAPSAAGLLMGGPVFKLLFANNGYISATGSAWVPPGPVFLVHCPDDDVIPFQNATAALAALSGAGVPVSIVSVPYVPLVEKLTGSIHLAAFPTAMLAAFTSIETVNRSH